MTKLSVNINKIATIRNARGGNTPNLLQMALDIESFGAAGITVHPRPDERHIRYADVRELAPRLRTEFNIEGNPTADFMKLVEEVRPTQVTLVPDSPSQLTSNAGWRVKENRTFLCEVLGELRALDIRSSIFVDCDLEEIGQAAELGADRIELYTEPYALLYPQDREEAVAPFVRAAELAHALGLGVNAGHDLSLENVGYLAECIPFLAEVSIGHALISEALYLGMATTVRRYLEELSVNNKA